MKIVEDKIEETRNQMNIDLLLQKITYYERSFQCLFDEDQLLLLYLQEKISINELKKQRNLINMEYDKQKAIQELQSNVNIIVKNIIDQNLV